MAQWEGVIVHYADYKDYDRMLTLVTPAMGKIEICARFVRRQNSRTKQGAQIFCYGEYELEKGSGDIYLLRHCTVKDSFFNLASRYEAFPYAAFIAALTQEGFSPGEANPNLFAELLIAYNLLAYGQVNPKLVTCNFIVKLMENAGFRPELGSCLQCGAKISRAQAGFSVEMGGTLCGDCLKTAGQAISGETLYMMQFLQKATPGQLSVLKISEGALGELFAVLSRYVCARFERGFRALKSLEEWKL